MRQCIAVAAVVLAVLTGHTAQAQTPGPEADPGVRPTRLIDRAEVRVSRVEIQPAAVFEIFIKPRAGASDRDLVGALALELAALGSPGAR